MTDVLNAPSFGTLDDYEGTTFTVDHEDGPVDLRLDEVETESVGDDWERFSLWFQSTDSPLSQDCYRLVDPQGEAFDVTIAPTMTADDDGETETYQAVFSRQPPDKDSDPMEAIAEGDHLSAEASKGSTSPWGTYFIGQTILFSSHYTIEDFYQCNGGLLSAAQHSELYAVIGNQYGGTTGASFLLPDLGGRVPLHRSRYYSVGATGGTETIRLTVDNLPGHEHTAKSLEVPVSDAEGAQSTPGGNILAKDPHGGSGRGANKLYTTEDDRSGSMAVSGRTGSVGGYESHTNMQPYLAMSYQLSMRGIFPPRRSNAH